MSVGWGSLPLLPLRCVLDHLSTEDALAALSTCRHWRSAILLYEARKETLKLRVKNLEKNLFLTRLFRKHTRKLHIYIDSSPEDLDNFMNYVLSQFFDTQKLEELIFIGPSYIQQNQNAHIAKINRIITESLVFKNVHCLQNLSLLGCEMAAVKNENDRYTHKHIEYYSRPLSFNSTPSPEDTVLSRCNVGLMMFSTLQHVILDYEQMSTPALQTLSQLQLCQLSLNIGLRRSLTLQRLDWHCLNNLPVAINIISVPQRMFNEIIDNVLVEGIALTALRVLFCKTFHSTLLKRVVCLYKQSLQELVWADAPFDSTDAAHRVIKPSRPRQTYPREFTMCNVNPLILLCWQCTHLRRLVIHGYWIWQYDLLGFVRLRKSLSELEVSATYSRQGRFSAAGGQDAVRVFARDTLRAASADLVQQVNAFTEFEWSPVVWERMHEALRPRASAAARAHYALRELARAAPAF